MWLIAYSNTLRYNPHMSAENSIIPLSSLGPGACLGPEGSLEIPGKASVTLYKGRTSQVKCNILSKADGVTCEGSSKGARCIWIIGELQKPDERTETDKKELEFSVANGRVRHLPERRTVFVDGREIELTKKRNVFLAALTSNPGVIVPRWFLVRELWPVDAQNRTAAKANAIFKHLQKDLEDDPLSPLLHTEVTGYRIGDKHPQKVFDKNKTQQLIKELNAELHKRKNIRFISTSNIVEVDGELQKLTIAGSKLLAAFRSRPETLFTRAELMNAGWEGYISKVGFRNEMGRMTSMFGPGVIENVRGAGYIFHDPSGKKE